MWGVSNAVDGPAQHGFEGGALRQCCCVVGLRIGALLAIARMRHLGFVEIAPIMYLFRFVAQAPLLGAGVRRHEVFSVFHAVAHGCVAVIEIKLGRRVELTFYQRLPQHF